MATYALEASTDLINWTVLNTFVSTTAAFTFTDYSAPSYPWRFYRLVLQ